jgi:hypothetical protein
MNVASQGEVEGVVADNGDLVVPSSELEQMNLVPGQRVPVKMPQTRKKRRDLYGALAGKVTPITREEIKESSREALG